MSSRSLQAKYCPRCGAMNALGAEICLHCGREFRHTQPAAPPNAPPPSPEDLHRTQMFTLPPPVARSEVGHSQPNVGRFAHLRAFFLPLRRSSTLLLVFVGLLAAAFAAALCWATALGLLGR